ncbi:MAG: hypothetical protein FWE82_10545, partial [Defluviitaleaceae bacterium]|nr:hypothetical protein [Defluviitaleaceae bacterium]
RYTFDFFFNEEDGKYVFTDPLYIQFLDLVKHFYLVHYQQTRSPEHYGHVNAFADKNESEMFLFQKSPFSAVQHIMPLTRGNPSFTGMVPLTDGGGKILLDSQYNPIRFSISKDSEKKELAWELIKFFAGPAYYDSVSKDSGDQLNYFSSANKNYMPVYKPTLEFLLDYYFDRDFTVSGLATYNQRYSITDDERVAYLMEFYEKHMVNEMVYIPDRWQLGALHQGFFGFLANAEYYGGSAIMEYMLEEVQKIYESYILSDLELVWGKSLVNNAREDPDYAWMFSPMYINQDRYRMEFLMQMEFSKMIFEIALLKSQLDTYGDSVYVWARLTPYSFNISVSLDYDTYISTFYTDETERLTQNIWNEFVNSYKNWDSHWEELAKIESVLELYEAFNELLSPHVNSFIDAYVAEHGAEALIPPPAEWYVYAARYGNTTFTVIFTNSFGDRLTQKTWDSFWELTDHDFGWLWETLYLNESVMHELFTDFLSPYIETFLINLGL